MSEVCRHLLGIKDLSRAEIAHIFSLSTMFQEVLSRPYQEGAEFTGHDYCEHFF